MEKQYRLSGNEVRQKFLDFFASKGCMIEPGASLIPHNDPTLLWINAGVSALKKYFDGSDVQHVTTHSLKCWVIFQSVITLRKKRLLGLGNF